MKNILLITLFILCYSATAQDLPPNFRSEGRYLGESVPLRSLPTIESSDARSNQVNAKDSLKTIRNYLRPRRKLNDNALPLNGNRLAQRENGGIQLRALDQNFDGINVNEGNAVPPDPTGAVGPNHYVAAVNLAVKVFDKSGNTLLGPVALNSFWPGSANNGDPIILYDQLADRWFLSQFQVGANSLLIAVSTTPDPTGTYNTWEFILDTFPDYPHYSLWHDAYLLTANKRDGVNNTFAFDRQALVAGDPSAQIVGFNLPQLNGGNPNTVLAPMSSNLLGTSFDPAAPGYIVYLQDDGWGDSNITVDHLKIWEVDLDWNNTANSTISQPIEVPTVPFESTFAPFGTGDIEQPGTTNKIDAISGVVSYMVQYRPFGTHNSMIVTFNEDIDGNDTSGVRWFELRNDATNDWSIFQEGTYAPNDPLNPGMSRFMSSAAIDAQGNIGMAYNVAGPNTQVGIRYTGRFNGDPLGQMTVAETTIIDGSGVQTNTNRFGDYAHLTMDVDNFTFWHHTEYFTAQNFWQTRIASFKLSSGFDNDIGVSNIVAPEDGVLSANEPVEVTLRNYGNLDQSGFNVELRVDGNLIATEAFVGTLTSGSTSQFTFVQTADLSIPGQTYTLSATTTLGSDQQTINDEFSKNVTNVFTNDLGITEITSPSSGEGLGSESVSVIIENFGALDQSNFDVSYTVNGGTPIVETINGTILAGQTLFYTFTQPADLSTVGSYSITASTLSVGDLDPSNDSETIVVSNFSCTTYNSTDTPIAISDTGTPTVTSTINVPDDFLVGDVNVTINISHTWTGDLDIKLIGPDGTTEVVLAEDLGSSGDNYTDTVFDDEATDPIASGTPPFTGVFQPAGNLSDLNGLSSSGNWTLSVFDDTDADGGFLNAWSLNLCEDTSLSAGENIFEQSLLVVHEGNRQYLVKLPTNTITDKLYMRITNMTGQTILTTDLEHNGGGYEYLLNLSDVASGMYLVRIGNNQEGAIKRIIVD